VSARGGGVRVSFTSDTSGLDRGAREGAAALEVVEKRVQQLSGGTVRLTSAQREQLLASAKQRQEHQRLQGALRALGVSEAEVAKGAGVSARELRTLGAASQHTGSLVKRHAEESVAANTLLTGSFKSMARQAVTAGAGFAGAYVGIAKAKDAIATTAELAHETEILHRNTGLSVKSSSEWLAVAKARNIQTNVLGRSFMQLSKTFLAADAGQKQATQTMKALGISQADVHKGATDFEFALHRTVSALGDLHGGTTRQVLAQQLLGRGFQSILPLFAEGNKGLQDQLDLAKKYHVELDGHTIKSVSQLVEAQRELKFASLGVQVQFAQGVAPSLIKVEAAASKMLGTLSDPNLTSDQKWQRISADFGKLAQSAEHAFEHALPKIADAAAKEAPHVASAFINGYLNAGPWGKLLLGAWLIKKMGGLKAFRAAGIVGGGAMAEGMVAGAEGGGVVGKFKGLAGFLGKTMGVVMAADIAFELAKGPISKALKGVVDPLTTAAGGGSGSPKGDRTNNFADLIGKAAHSPHPLIGTGRRTEAGDRSLTLSDIRAYVERFGNTKVGSQIKAQLPQIQKDFPHMDVGNIDKSRAALNKLGTSEVAVTKAAIDLSHAHGNNIPIADKLQARLVTLYTRIEHTRRGTAEYAALTRQANRVLAEQERALGILPPKLDHASKSTLTLSGRVAGATAAVGQFSSAAKGQLNSAASAAASAMNKIQGSFLSEMKAIGLDAGKAAAAALHTKATGGYVGDPGAKGRDTVPLAIPPGWFVVSGPQQQALGLASGGLVPTLVGEGEYLGSPEEAPLFNALAAAQGYGGLGGLFAAVTQPHYMARGGIVQRFAAGGQVAKMIATANAIDHHHYPYLWGGGHTDAFAGPYDCSGAVSAIAHSAGLLAHPMVAADFMRWGQPGPGEVTTYASPGHVYMSIDGKFFGTSNANPGGGAGWFPGGPRPGFTVRHWPVSGSGSAGAGLVKAPKIVGPDSPLKSIVVGASKKATSKANKRLQDLLASTGAAGGGDWGNLADFKGGGPAKFARTLLSTLGIQPTQRAIAEVVAWEQQEGGNWNNSARFNPLNTTLDEPGARSINGVGVKAYTSWSQGLKATVDTLKHYPTILAALRGGSMSQFKAAVNASPWGTKFARGGFVGGDGGSIDDVMFRFVNPIAGPKGPKGKKPQQPHEHYVTPSPGKTGHWQPMTAQAYQTYVDNYIRQYGQRPPSGPKKGSTANKPHRYVINGHIVWETPAQHAQRQARAQQAKKHDTAYYQHVQHTIIDPTDVAAGRYETTATDLGNAYDDATQDIDYAQRTLDTHANDNTEAGRLQHIAGIRSIEAKRDKARGKLVAKKAALVAEASRYAKAIRQLKQQLKHAPPNSRKQIASRIRGYQTKLKEVHRAAHQAGIDIGSIGLDLLGDESAIAQIIAKEPSTRDRGEAALALAQLTPDTADDIAAYGSEAAGTGILGGDAKELAVAIASGDPGQIATAAGQLQSDRDAFKQLTQAVTDNTQALLDLKTQQAQIAQQQLAVSQSQYGVLAKAIADVANGEIGGRLGLGFQSPSFAGGMASY
jgi:hypothetical protein